MFPNLISILVIAGVILIALLTMALIVSRMYRRASKEVSFVRTGFRGQKVIMNGGALVVPVLHEAIPVNMNTLRLEVQRANTQALIADLAESEKKAILGGTALKFYGIP